MKKNMGSLDRIIRIVLAVIIGVLFWQDTISGALGYTLLAAASVFVITSFVSFCPLYALIGLDTCKVKN